MQEFLFLCAGLGFGIAIAGWQRLKTERALERIQASFPADIKDVPLSSLWRLRRGVSWYAERNDRLQLAVDCWESAIQAAPIGYLQIDSDNYLRRSNAVARHLLGLPERVTRMPPRLLLELVRSYELDRLIEKTRKTQTPQMRRWTFHPISDNVTEIERSQPLALCGRSFLLPNGHIGVWLENQQEVAELRESRDRWVCDLAHELRTPLTSIKLVAENLEHRLDGTMRDWVARLIPETDRLIALVRDWLDLTKLETDRHLSCEPVEIAALIADVWTTLEPIAERRQIALDFRNCGPPSVRCNRDRMFRVFLNLLDNAVQYSPDGTTIVTAISRRDPSDRDAASAIVALITSDASTEIASSRRTEVVNDSANDSANGDAAPDYVTIDIIDAGPGFSAADLPRVFERLYRGDRSRARPGSADRPARHTSGSGLGLSIVEQIVRAHSGTIVARNVPHRSGAWIQVSLPIEVEPVGASETFSVRDRLEILKAPDPASTLPYRSPPDPGS